MVGSSEIIQRQLITCVSPVAQVRFRRRSPDQFLAALVQSLYFAVVFAIEIMAGLALLANWKTPLALKLLAPVIVNILLFHITMAPAGLPPELFVTILWLGVAYRVRAAFAGIAPRRGGRALQLAANGCGTDASCVSDM